VDVETDNGRVVAVWFRCQLLPFRQAEVDVHRAADMDQVNRDLDTQLLGVHVLDAAQPPLPDLFPAGESELPVGEVDQVREVPPAVIEAIRRGLRKAMRLEGRRS
jgi:hypothetical protein